LRSIAAASGGVFEPRAESVFDRPQVTASRAVPLWPYLAAAAVVLFVLDVALRRIDLTLVFQRRGRFSLSTRAA
jgi:Ca-activated chloride channel family protein